MFYPMRQWNPFDVFDRMLSQWQQHVLGSFWPAVPSLPSLDQMDVQQGDQDAVIRIEVPGISPEDLSVTVRREHAHHPRRSPRHPDGR